MSSRSRLPGVLGVIAATMGLFFSAFSTHDYALHLDRQLHATNCSFVPGIAGPEGGDNACKAAMYSSYSAIFRDKYWGGIPISLFAMGAYAFFLAMAIYLLTAGNAASKRSWQTYGLASLTPIIASAIMFTISITKLGQFCKLCVGLYVASAILAISGAWALWKAGGTPGFGGSATDTIPDAGPPVPAGYPLHAYAIPEPPKPPGGGGLGASLVPTGSLLVPLALFPVLAVFSVAPSLVYASSMPDYRPMLLSCGKILEPNEKTGALVKIKTLRPVQAALTFEDPLCPTCRAFHKRLQTEEIYDRLDLTVAIFPLDSECNPMLDRPFHPGSCQLAKAFLCGDKVGKAREILDWSYDNQEELRDAGKAGKEIIRAKIKAKFPDVDACIDDKETKKRLDRILQFAIANKIPISTPQMFLGDTRLCEEDTDLGLRYVMGQLAPQVFQPLEITKMKLSHVLSVLVGAGLLVGVTSFVGVEVKAAEKRLTEPKKADAPVAATADHTEAPYCTPQFKSVLQRVVNACGLVGEESGRRGCQPVDVKTFASISDDDFNALFAPLEQRGAIILFDDGADKLDEGAKKLIMEKWEDRRLARYFFIVSRASKSGTTDMNKALSHKRANSVNFWLQEQAKDPELDKKVGMLWLGEEFAQLPKDYCDKWTHSRPGKPCTADGINRSAFISWVDCRL